MEQDQIQISEDDIILVKLKQISNETPHKKPKKTQKNKSKSPQQGESQGTQQNENNQNTISFDQAFVQVSSQINIEQKYLQGKILQKQDYQNSTLSYIDEDETYFKLFGKQRKFMFEDILKQELPFSFKIKQEGQCNNKNKSHDILFYVKTKELENFLKKTNSQQNKIENESYRIQSQNLKKVHREFQTISSTESAKLKRGLSRFNISFTPMSLIKEKFNKISQEYELENPPLGVGAFGEVRKAIHKISKNPRAIKILKKKHMTPQEQQKLIAEVNIMKQLNHPNILRVYEFFQDEQFLYIVTEVNYIKNQKFLCLGGELFDKLTEEGKISEKRCATIMKQVLGAVAYCHANNIVHRDLKPENLLLETKEQNSAIKVIDFGTSKNFVPNESMNQFSGTPYYIAPEVLKRNYNEKCDVWSCGVILYILLTGYPPFNGNDDQQIMNNVLIGKFSFPRSEWKDISQQAKDFISKMLTYDYEKRITAQQALEDPWIKNYSNPEAMDVPLVQSVIKNMKNFRHDKKLQEASWMFLVQYFITEEEKQDLLNVFRQLDINNDGQLSRDELKQGFLKFMNEEQAELEVEEIMKASDKDNNGAIDYNEFVIASASRKNMIQKDRLEKAFQMFDMDKSGQIDIEELKQIFSESNVSSEAWIEIIQEVDEDGDGQISFREFQKMMLKLLSYDEKQIAKKQFTASLFTQTLQESI